MHAFANLRKTKSASIVLVLMFIISSLLLNIGLLVVINYGSFFDKLKEELKPSNNYYLISDSIYTDKVKNYLENNEHIKKTQTHDARILEANILSKEEENSFRIMFVNMDEAREISQWKFVGEHLPAEEMSVYVPDIFKAVSGYQLNDKMDLKFTDYNTGEEKTLTFTVKGYTEDVFFSSTDTGYLSFYVPEDTFEKVEEVLNHPTNKAHLVYTDLDDVKNSPAIESGIRDILNMQSSSSLAADPTAMIFTVDIELIELSRCMMASMVSVMMVMFAFVIAAVCLLVVRFRIVNSIEEDIMKIGSMKSIGYTSKQIILTIILQFSILAGIGSIVGIALSYPALPGVSAVFKQQSGLKWEQGFDGIISGSVLLIILLIAMLVSLLASRRICKLNPINALRGEGSTQKYKKNHLQLERSKGSLPFVLAIKSVLQSMKQNVMIIVILMAVSFSGAFGVIMFYNTTVDTKAFAEIPGMEICNVVAVLNPMLDQSEAVDTIKNMEHVRKVMFLDEVKVKIDDTEISVFVIDNYDEKETRTVYEGRYPQSNNEITLAGKVAERLGKSVGDVVSLRYGDNEEQFTVVGLSNGSSGGGLNASIRTEDYKRLNPDYKRLSLYIYLDGGIEPETFIQTLESTIDKDMLLTTANFDKLMNEGMAAYQNIVSAVGIVMLAITLMVVALVLYFVIVSAVTRKKRELGIQKAIGFTTFQLMNQLSISFTIPIMLGAVIGTTLGAFYTNPMLSIALKGMGVMKANFITDPLYMVLFGIGTIIFSYFLALLITWRIRKISAYALVTE